MLRKYLFLCIVAGWSVIAPSAQATAQDPGTDWKLYHETNLTVDFPANLFVIRTGNSDIGHGSRYRTRNGRATLMIYELRNEQSWTPSRYLNAHLAIAPGRLEYKRVTGRFFAISGVKDATTFYSRCNFGRLYIGCIYLRYPAADNALWDRVVTRISLSLRVRPD